MPTIKLTEAAIQRFKKPETGQVEYFDSLLPAFGIRVSYAGSKSWFVTCRVSGQRRQIRTTLGRFPSMGLAEARKHARDVIAGAERGIDPRQQKKNAKAEAERKSELTFSKVSQEFLQNYARRSLKPKTVTEYELAFKRAAKWSNWPIDTITKADVRSILDEQDNRGNHVAGDATFRYLRAFFNWCAMERELLDHSPCISMKRKGHANKRERFLSETELSALWHVVASEPYPFGPFVSVLMLTGQRRGEVSEMRWDEIEGQTWIIPGDKTKNGLPHVVPLSASVVSVLKGCPQIGDYVFSTTGETPISGFSKFKRRLGSSEALKDFSSWTLHDLRRTMVTHMNEKLGVQPHVVEAVVNHVSGASKAGVAGIYNRALYLEERRTALNSWAEFIESIARHGTL